MLLAKDFPQNIELSTYKFVRAFLEAKYYINYSGRADATLEQRIKDRVTDYWKWLSLAWLTTGPGWGSISQLQINCNTLIISDPFSFALARIRDDVEDELNVNSFPLWDYTGCDPANPIDPEITDNLVIPRFRGHRMAPNEAGETVAVTAITYDIHVWRESVLP
jgi:hypothetical protein